MYTRKILLALLFIGSVAYSQHTLTITGSRLDSLLQAVAKMYNLPPDTTGLAAATTPIMTYNGTKWVAASGLTVSIGSAAFTTTDLRKAVYISGALSTDYCVVSSRSADGLTGPADILSRFMKTDSLIVTRDIAPTSGLVFDYIRAR